MNKEIGALFILVLIAVLCGWKLFHPQFYTTHDGGGHLIRMEEFRLSFSDGQFPVRIAKRINYGLGYPFFHFNYPFVYYAADVLQRGGLTTVGAFKALLFLSLIAGSLGIYWYSRFFSPILPSLVASIFYTVVPYRFLNMYVRGAVGEALGLALLPFTFASVEYMFRGKTRIFPFVFSFSLLILSHNITALVGGVFIGCYAVVRIMAGDTANKSELVKRCAVSGVVSLLITCWFWLPALYDSRLTKLVELRDDYKDFFPTLSEMVYSPWGFGPWKEGPYPGKMSPRVGVVHLLVGVSSVLILLLRRFFNTALKRSVSPNAYRVAIFFTGATVLFIFFSLSVSAPLWDRVILLQVVQHPWRVVGYIVLCLSVLAGFVLSIVPNNYLQRSAAVLFLVVLLYTNRNHIRVNQYIDYISPFKQKQVYEQSTTSNDEHMPLYAPRVYGQAPNPDGDLIPVHTGVSTREIWRSNYHRFQVSATQSAFFRDNTSYFPGWIGAVDGKPVAILHTEDDYKRLLVRIAPGIHTVEFWFIEPLYRKIINSISVAALAGFAYWTLAPILHKKKA